MMELDGDFSAPEVVVWCLKSPFILRVATLVWKPIEEMHSWVRPESAADWRSKPPWITIGSRDRKFFEIRPFQRWNQWSEARPPEMMAAAGDEPSEEFTQKAISRTSLHLYRCIQVALRMTEVTPTSRLRSTQRNSALFLPCARLPSLRPCQRMFRE